MCGRSARTSKETKFLEASDKYLCAAQETERRRGTQRKATEYRANADFYRSWGLYARTQVSGTFGRSDLDHALQLAKQARGLWRQATNPIGERAADGWRLYLEGVQSGLASKYGEAKQAFEAARRIYLEIEEQVPGVQETTRPMIRLAEEQAIFADITNIWSSEDCETHQGEINRRVAELTMRAGGAERPLYQSLGELARAQCGLKEGSDRLVSWKYSEAGKVLAEAERAIADARRLVAPTKAVPLGGTEQHLDLIDGWTAAIHAEQDHAKALEALLARGDLGSAKAEFIAAVESYRAARQAFEKAFLGAQPLAELRTRSRRLQERAEVVDAAFGPKEAASNVGRLFLAIFFGTLGILLWLKPRLGLSGHQVVWLALVVGIIGAFGLRATDIFYAMKSLPKIG